jgi:hypothetical protein
LVINEIHYHPLQPGDEFVELKSITNGTLPLYNPGSTSNTWRLNGIGFDFPTNVQVAPNGLILVVASDPVTFRTAHAVPTAVPILGPYPGHLQNGGETLSLQRPDAPDLNTNTGAWFVPYIDVDVVHYNNETPWPTAADGAGASLERLQAAGYGNDPINWRASPFGPSPGFDNVGYAPPGTITSFDVVSDPAARLRLHFAAGIGQSYTVQYTTSLAGGIWLKLTDVPAQNSTQIIEISDPIVPGEGQRFYRIVTPAQP